MPATARYAASQAEFLDVDYAALPAVIDARFAGAADAPQLHQAAPGNVCFRWARGDEAAVRESMQKAAHVTRLDLINNRLIGGTREYGFAPLDASVYGANDDSFTGADPFTQKSLVGILAQQLNALGADPANNPDLMCNLCRVVLDHAPEVLQLGPGFTH